MNDEEDMAYALGVTLGGFLLRGERVIRGLRRAEQSHPARVREVIEALEPGLSDTVSSTGSYLDRIENELNKMAPPLPVNGKGKLRNLILWSPIRARLYVRCPRRYHYRYILAWEGWSPDSNDQSQMAYKLSHVSSLAEMVGSAVHAAIAVGLASPLEEFGDDVIAAQAAALDEDIRARMLRPISAVTKATPGLLEAVLRIGISAADIQDAVSLLVTCLQEFRAHSIALEVTSHPRLVLPQFRDPFYRTELGNGVLVMASPDLVLRGDDGITIVDWKTGAPHASHREAALVYELVVRTRLADWRTPVEVIYVYLAAGTESRWTFAVHEVETVADQIRGEYAALRAASDDPVINVGAQQRFRTEPGAQCQRCAFSLVCDQKS